MALSKRDIIYISSEKLFIAVYKNMDEILELMTLLKQHSPDAKTKRGVTGYNTIKKKIEKRQSINRTIDRELMRRFIKRSRFGEQSKINIVNTPEPEILKKYLPDQFI